MNRLELYRNYYHKASANKISRIRYLKAKAIAFEIARRTTDRTDSDVDDGRLRDFLSVDFATEYDRIFVCINQRAFQQTCSVICS